MRNNTVKADWEKVIESETPVEFRRLKSIYYLESIARNLKEFAGVLDDIPMPSIGGGALEDNRDWLSCYIDYLKRLQSRSLL